MQLADGAQRLIPSTYCPFCTENIGLSLTQTRDSDATDAFSLGNLLPCGTITVSVHDGGSPCPGASDSHHWHSLPVRNLSTHPEDTLFRQLAFLTEHLFLRATCKLGLSGRHIFIRIYLVPIDLPNVCGRLHHRPEAVVKEARRHMHDVVPLIEQNNGLWDADETCLGAPQSHLLSSQTDNRTMAEIYGELPSPDLSPLMNEKNSLSYRIASGDMIWGLRTTLYGYQRRSVAIMLHKESNTSPTPDPTYIAVSCMSGDRCYLQPSTMTVFRGCPLFSPPRAGILCEELGTGKTIMIIALILATATQHADPEQSPVDERPAMTPLAYAHFPSREHALARDRAGLGQKAILQVPSLVEVLLDYFSMPKAASARQRFADELEASHLWPLIQANKPFYHHFDTNFPAQVLRRSCRRLVPNVQVSPRTMFLSSATLVIVPLTLLGQWKIEIDKHCYDNVRYLIVRPSMILPDAKKLASDYELIVMSDTRFRKESKKDKTVKLNALKPCACPSLEGSRVPDCWCPGDPDVTPLFQVRWKRLIIDEGHTVGNVATAINHFVRKLSIQHKWIVSGTPTSNLLSLQMGHTTDEQESDQYVDPEVESEELLYPDSDCSQDGRPCHVRVWGNYDSLNLRKLGAMIADFIAVPQFRADLKGFTFHVSTPLCDPHGPRPGSIKILSQVMQTVMVRHRVEDVESDVLLPPIEHQIVYMDLDNYARISYNAMQAGLAINAIDSMREGKDYMFHPSKAKELQKAIDKSSQGLFWFSSDNLYNVDEICRLAECDYMRKAIERIQKGEISPQDLDLLQQALEHATTAANDQVWRATQAGLSEVLFKVSGLDPAISEAWNRTELRDTSKTTCFMHPDRLVLLRSLVRKNPLISRDELIEEGKVTEWNEQVKSASKSKSSHKANHVSQTKKMAKEVQGTIEVMMKNIERMNISEDELEEHQDGGRITQVTSTEASAIRVTGSLHLSGVKVGNSLSTKLNYILSEVQQYSAKEKFLVFSSSPMTLFQIYEALSLFEIKCLRYTNEVDYLLREQCITTFETSDVYRVLLMDLKLGARGLNLISASRVIFCEPVWHPDVESQAIKRVHRIGQTRPVTVKTLVIRSTAEEAMISRRQYLRGSDKIPSNMMAESGMRQYLQYPSFLNESTSSDLSSLVLSLDHDRVTSVNVESTAFGEEFGGANCIDVGPESEIPVTERSEDRAGDVMARKRARFE